MSASPSQSSTAKKQMTDAWNAILASTPKGQTPAVPTPSQYDLYQCAIWLNKELSAKNVQYYFCGGFACINVGMTARTTSDIDIAVPNGAVGYGTLLDMFSTGPFIKHGDNHYFYTPNGSFVEVDGIIAGWQAFPELTKARIIKVGNPQHPELQLPFLEPAGLLRLKLSTWANETRRKSNKRQGDESDIISIRDLLASNLKAKGKKMEFMKTLDAQMVKGLKDWIKEYKDLAEWQAVDASIKG
ncbi:hypothetical protein Daus18300_013298 [Diaporthe australafricana]|uniref:Uncharacterized protein n=1 Tax=Diaporthe australafricana TaxID=127596 RepID=A0ABR3VZQ0_9PEZI